LHQPVSANVVWHESEVPREERWGAAGVRGATVWFTGLSGSGKSTVASAVAALLTERGVLSYTLDGDNLRHGLNGDLGFSADDRAENVRRVGEVARLFADAGVIALVTPSGTVPAIVFDTERFTSSGSGGASGAQPFSKIA
jgi:adenylylsulfate kinase